MLAFESADQLRHALLAMEAHRFVSHHILEPIPHAFAGDFLAWLEWKEQLANTIDVDPKDIALIGSSSLGYSLNPSKSFKPFDDRSDIDCCIISEYYFSIAWRQLRQKRVSWLTLDSNTKHWIKEHRKRLVYDGAIATDRILGILSFGQLWQSALDQASQIHPTAGRDVKIRIYRDYESLRQYLIGGIEYIRSQLEVSDDINDSPLILEE